MIKIPTDRNLIYKVWRVVVEARQGLIRGGRKVTEVNGGLDMWMWTEYLRAAVIIVVKRDTCKVIVPNGPKQLKAEKDSERAAQKG